MDLTNRIEQFFDGTLTFEEEQELYLYLCSNEVPPALQRDKEAIMALCADTNDYTLPAGAAERLSAMLDALNEEQHPIIAGKKQPSVSAGRLKMIPINVWRYVAVAAGVALVITFSVATMQQLSQDEYTVAYEQDTFDNPEEAMECAKSALGELFLAMNTTRQNAKEIGNTLEDVTTMIGNRIPKQ